MPFGLNSVVQVGFAYLFKMTQQSSVDVMPLSVADDQYPHVIINELHRSKLDANRDIEEAAFGDHKAELAWNEFHSYVDRAKLSATFDGRSAFYVDIHGHVSL